MSLNDRGAGKIRSCISKQNMGQAGLGEEWIWKSQHRVEHERRWACKARGVEEYLSRYSQFWNGEQG